MRFALSLSVLLLSCTASAAPTWTFQKIATAAGGNRKVALRLDPSGAPHLAFTGCTDEACKINELIHAVRGSDGAWKLESIDAANKDTGWFAAMEIEPSGGIHIVYANHAKAKQMHAYRAAGGEWKKGATTSRNGGWWNATALAPSGKLWTASTGLEGGWNYPDLQIGLMQPGGDWAFETADHGNNVGWFPSITLDRAEDPVVTYVSGGYPVGDLRLVRKTAAGLQTDWIDRQAVKSSVQVDAQGVIHVIYQFSFDNEIKHSNLMYARSDAPAKWDLTLVDGDEELKAETGWHPTLVLDASGGRHTLYRDMKQNCLVYSRNLGEGWSKPACAGKRGDGGLYPVAAFDAQGKMHVAYDSGNEIFYGTCEGCGPAPSRN